MPHTHLAACSVCRGGRAPVAAAVAARHVAGWEGTDCEGKRVTKFA